MSGRENRYRVSAKRLQSCLGRGHRPGDNYRPRSRWMQTPFCTGGQWRRDRVVAGSLTRAERDRAPVRPCGVPFELTIRGPMQPVHGSTETTWQASPAPHCAGRHPDGCGWPWPWGFGNLGPSSGTGRLYPTASFTPSPGSSDIERSSYGNTSKSHDDRAVSSRRLNRCSARVCAVTRRRFPVGARPTRRPLQPEGNRSSQGGNELAEAFGMRVTNCDSASVQAATRVNAKQASKRTMRRPTRQPFREGCTAG